MTYAQWILSVGYAAAMQHAGAVEDAARKLQVNGGPVSSTPPPAPVRSGLRLVQD
jgi:hypothetical protein